MCVWELAGGSADGVNGCIQIFDREGSLLRGIEVVPPALEAIGAMTGSGLRLWLLALRDISSWMSKITCMFSRKTGRLCVLCTSKYLGIWNHHQTNTAIWADLPSAHTAAWSSQMRKTTMCVFNSDGVLLRFFRTNNSHSWAIASDVTRTPRCVCLLSCGNPGVV